MILIKKETWEIGITRCSVRYWKPTTCGSQENFFSLENGRDFKFVNVRSYYINTLIQLYWLKWILYIKIKPKLLSGAEPLRYVKFEDTHFELMGIPKGNWNDSEFKGKETKRGKPA